MHRAGRGLACDLDVGRVGAHDGEDASDRCGADATLGS
jgi:hypothetical protein